MNAHNQDRDAFLDEAVRCLRNRPVDERRLTGALDITRRVLHDAMQDDHRTGGTETTAIFGSLRWRRIMKTRWIQIAAAAAVVVAFLGVTNWFRLDNGKSGLVFAEVMQRICSSRTVTFNMAIERPGQPSMTMKAMELMPGRRRVEMPDGASMIMDRAARKALVLNPAAKKATCYDRLGPADAAPEQDFFDRLLQLRDQASEDLGQQEIEGRLATGFHVKDQGADWSIWVDPATGLPLRVEVTCDLVFSPGMKLVMRDFAFNVDLDETLFSLDPPAGYTLETKDLKIPASGEEAIINCLRLCADVLGGKFPQKLDGNLAPRIVKKAKAAFPNETSEQRAERIGPIMAGLVFVQQLPPDSDWHYAAGGVTLGQADVPICWWKPAGSDTYRVIFGDLSARDLDKAELDRLTAEQPQTTTGD
jgi:outer membrane lipoprotein-sorting protein